MTEDQVIQIAQQYVIDNSLDKCSFEAVRRFKQGEIPEPTTIGDKWVVQFRIEENEDEGISGIRTLVIVDDATGEPQFFETM